MHLCGRRESAIAAAFLLLLPASGSAAEGPPAPVLNWYGQSGLLDMPSARMLPDGQLAVTISSLGSLTERYNLTFQALPWLEGTFRYSRIDKLVGVDLYDRSLSFKARLVEESGYVPNIALGFQDILGTGIFGAEYLVATKSFGNVEVTLGLGWGRFGTLGTFGNPFTLFSKSFKTRPINTGLGSTGQVRLNQFFHGADTAPFGGVVWHTGFHDISAIVEFSGDRYTAEQNAGAIAWRSPFNFGLSYRPFRGIELGAGYFYGTLWGLRASLTTNAAVDPFPVRLGTPVPAPMLRTPEERREAVASAVENSLANGAQAPVQSGAPPMQPPPPANLPLEPMVRERIVALARQQNLQIEHIALTANEAAISFTNTRYRRETEAIGRLARILMQTLPPAVERFRFISMLNGFPTEEVVIERSSLERTFIARGDGADILSSSEITAASPRDPLLSQPPVAPYPRFAWALGPQFRQSLFDPSQPFRFAAVALASGSVDFGRGFSIDGAFEVDLFDTFDNLRDSNSLLPHVRSDIKRYFEEGKNGIEHLQGTYQWTVRPGVYAIVRAGYLESMFAGAGGEILWRPQQARWALGFTLYQVWQREFDRLFGLRDYSVLIGHASLYYESRYYGLNFNVHAGRYLAGDYGVTFEVTRRFDSGFEIGAFTTFTNVPFSKFGEGSFDKGLIIRIPLEALIPLHTQSEARLDFTSLTRDGGQRLYNEQMLYGATRRTSYGEIVKGWNDVVQP